MIAEYLIYKATFPFSFESIDSLEQQQIMERKEQERRQTLRKQGLAKSLYCSDGRVFGSLTLAAEALGLDRGALTYLVKLGRSFQGLMFSRVPLIPSVEG